MNDNLILETKEDMLYQSRVLFFKKSLPYVVLALVVAIAIMVVCNIYNAKIHKNRYNNTEKLIIAIEQKDKKQLYELSQTDGVISNLAKLNIYNIYLDTSVLKGLYNSKLPLLNDYVAICQFSNNSVQKDGGDTNYAKILTALSFLEGKKYNEAKALLHKLSNDNTISSIEQDLIKAVQDEIHNNINIRNNISN